MTVSWLVVFHGSNILFYSMVSATPRFSKEPARRRLRNGPRRCRVIFPRLGHHQPKPEGGEGGDAGQGKKGAIIARSLDNHPTDGIAERCPNASGSTDRAVCDVEAAGTASEIGHDEDREHTKDTRPDAIEDLHRDQDRGIVAERIQDPAHGQDAEAEHKDRFPPVRAGDPPRPESDWNHDTLSDYDTGRHIQGGAVVMSHGQPLPE